MNEQKHKRHAAREAFQESLERLQQVLDLGEEQVDRPEPHDRAPSSSSTVQQPPGGEEATLDVWEDAVNDIDRFLQSD